MHSNKINGNKESKISVDGFMISIAYSIQTLGHM